MMGEVLSISANGERLRELTLEQLFLKAEQFGCVRIYSSRDERPPNCYSCHIEFDSIPGTSVEAKSEYSMQLHDSIIQAIDRAERITEAYSR